MRNLLSPAASAPRPGATMPRSSPVGALQVCEISDFACGDGLAQPSSATGAWGGQRSPGKRGGGAPMYDLTTLEGALIALAVISAATLLLVGVFGMFPRATRIRAAVVTCPTTGCRAGADLAQDN